MAAGNYGTYGGAVSSIFGAFSSIMEINAKNKSIEAQAQYNVEMYKAQSELTKFAKDNNVNNAEQIVQQINQEKSNAIDKTNLKIVDATSKEVNKRSSGITAGNSVQRSVDDIIKKGAEAKANINSKTDSRISNLMGQLYATNNAEQLKINAMYNNMQQKNTQLAGQAITGVAAALQVGQATLQAGKYGAELGKSIKKVQESTPDNPMDGIQFSDNTNYSTPSQDLLSNNNSNVNTLLIKQ